MTHQSIKYFLVNNLIRKNEMLLLPYMNICFHIKQKKLFRELLVVILETFLGVMLGSFSVSVKKKSLMRFKINNMLQINLSYLHLRSLSCSN